jgi:hypothetical protein
MVSDSFGLFASAPVRLVTIDLVGSEDAVLNLARGLACLPGVGFVDDGSISSPGNLGDDKIKFRVLAVVYGKVGET